MRGLAKAGLGALQPLILALWFSLGTALAYDAEDDLTQVPFEELVKQEVITASKLSRQISASPSAVTVVTANDIRAYGYRTIADVINSIPGLSTFTDRDYAYLGGRGLGGAPGGEYAGRIMLLIDGYATQDNIFNQAYIDNSGLLDMEMVERVEYVPGTGSAIYGNNAMFGIINVVTKKGASFNGAQVSLEGASLGGRKERLTYGKRTEGGWDMLFSASSLESDGQSGLYYPGLNYPFLNYPFLNRGIINNMDWERGQRLFGKIERDGLSLEAGWVKREKPSIYNLAPTLHGRLQSYLVSDENGFVNIRYETDLGLALKSSSRFYMGRYANRDSWQYAPALYSLGYYSGSNNVVGEWRGFEQQFVATWFQDHMLLFGLEYRDDSKRTVAWNILRQDLSVFLKGSSEFPRKTLSAYLTDEWTLGPKWKLNLGARYDRPNDVKAALSPRVALIYQLSPDTSVKASYSEAFRLPSAQNLRDFTDPVASEHIVSSEIVVQHDFSPLTRLTASLYQHTLSNQYAYDPIQDDYFPTGVSKTHGLELALQRRWEHGQRLSGSLAWQQTTDVDGLPLVNAPNFLAKINYTFPMWANALRTGIEIQYNGPIIVANTRRTLDGVAMANLTFSSEQKWHGVSGSFSIRNLFNKRYESVLPLVLTPAGSSIVQDTQQMDGRTLWLQLNYDL